VSLYQASAALHEMRGEREDAWQHQRHARMLHVVAAQYAARRKECRAQGARSAPALGSRSWPAAA
jgi:hypothetical protein